MDARVFCIVRCCYAVLSWLLGWFLGCCYVSYIVTRVLSCQEICYTVARVLKVVARVLAGLLCL